MTPDLSRAKWRKSTRSNTGGNCVEVAAIPTVWHKSSRSQNGGNCVEVAELPAYWHKSTRSQTGGNCVEVGAVAEVIGVRDSKDCHGPALLVSSDAWQAFTTALRGDTLGQ